MANESIKIDANNRQVVAGVTSSGEIRNLEVANDGSVSTTPSSTSPEYTEHDTTLDAKVVTEVRLTVRVAVDSTNTNYEYVGEAVAGSIEAAGVWSIKRIDTTTGTKVLWADGNADFDNFWSNREALSYS